jgi:DNA-binding Xre family transcriptional regulator
MTEQPISHPLVIVLARNVQHLAFKRGWSPGRLARELGVTSNTLTRVRLGRSRYIDPEVFAALLDVFDCEPNDLLTRQPDIDYSAPTEQD